MDRPENEGLGNVSVGDELPVTQDFREARFGLYRKVTRITPKYVICDKHWKFRKGDGFRVGVGHNETAYDPKTQLGEQMIGEVSRRKNETIRRHLADQIAPMIKTATLGQLEAIKDILQSEA